MAFMLFSHFEKEKNLFWKTYFFFWQSLRNIQQIAELKSFPGFYFHTFQNFSTFETGVYLGRGGGGGRVGGLFTKVDQTY